MQTVIKILSGFFIFLTFTCCSGKEKNTEQVKNLEQVKIEGDTLKIKMKTLSDTVFRKYMRLDNKTEENHTDTSIYSVKSIDTTIARSNFYFTAQGFKVYFDKQKVLAYCDSIIKITPPDKKGTGYANWGIINGMKELKKAAQSNDKMEVVLADWLTILLERFDPLIITEKTNQTSKLLLKEKFLSRTFACRNYSSISTRGDTSFIWLEQDYQAMQLVR